ncbi:MAG: N-formylglutamate amidohydrolase [Methylococcales bacterium]|nr:N-formylglutamate amidohydrolase [Methylococcales bacterium]
MQSTPEWVIFHVPHDSTLIPAEIRQQFVLDDKSLNQEIIKMTDHHTLDLFTQGVPEQQIVRAPVSRLVIDVERFTDDAQETMVEKGMGVIYTRTANGEPLRKTLTAEDRQALIKQWYTPHHERLINVTQKTLEKHNKVLIIDAHSFPSVPLKYEYDQRLTRPDICIGTDAFHTPNKLAAVFIDTFEDAGFNTSLNEPFAGALVPMPYYHTDKRVSAVMIEVNRGLYLDENTGHPNIRFKEITRLLTECIAKSLVTVIA